MAKLYAPPTPQDKPPVPQDVIGMLTAKAGSTQRALELLVHQQSIPDDAPVATRRLSDGYAAFARRLSRPDNFPNSD